MKKGIHPSVNEVVATCVCGASFKTFTTKDKIRVDICSACHPFFTGAEKIIDTEGRVERYRRRYNLKK